MQTEADVSADNHTLELKVSLLLVRVRGRARGGRSLRV
jgi:hypothetical protein